MGKILFGADGHIKKDALRGNFNRKVTFPIKVKKHLNRCPQCRDRKIEVFMEYAINETLSRVNNL